MTNIDNLTNAELDEAWARMIYGVPIKIVEGKVYRRCMGGADAWYEFSPTTSWADWGVCYEFMVGRGWNFEMGDNHKRGPFYCVFQKEPYKEYWGYNPDLRRASLIAGAKALRGEGK